MPRKELFGVSAGGQEFALREFSRNRFCRKMQAIFIPVYVVRQKEAFFGMLLEDRDKINNVDILFRNFFQNRIPLFRCYLNLTKFVKIWICLCKQLIPIEYLKFDSICSSSNSVPGYLQSQLRLTFVGRCNFSNDISIIQKIRWVRLDRIWGSQQRYWNFFH